jgi:rhomboid protease GluP
MIMVINFGLYAATVIYSMRQGNSGALMNIDGRTLFDFGAKLTQAIALGQWWRLITAGFLHGGLIHILMNSWVLFDLGSQVEEIYGWARLIVFYLAATVLGFYASAWWSPSISIGASAGIFGLLGAMIALGVRHKSPAGAAIRGVYMRWAMYGLIMSFLPGARYCHSWSRSRMRQMYRIRRCWWSGTRYTRWRRKRLPRRSLRSY